MNLYLLSQSVNNDWDTYDSVVVAAQSEEAAARIHPSADYREFGPDGCTYFKYADGIKKKEGAASSDWCQLKDVSVKLIGVAVEGTESGIILASYNSG